VSRVVRLGGSGVIIVTTQAGARVEIGIVYPAGSKPANGTTGASGYALKDGTFVYRWIASGSITPGTAVVRVRVLLGRRTGSRVTSFTLVR